MSSLMVGSSDVSSTRSDWRNSPLSVGGFAANAIGSNSLTGRTGSMRNTAEDSVTCALGGAVDAQAAMRKTKANTRGRVIIQITVSPRCVQQDGMSTMVYGRPGAAAE